MLCSTTPASAAATITPASMVWSSEPISSSSVNVTAAIGALNAAAIPAAMPTDVMRRLFTGLSRAMRDRKLLTPAQICTVGPSTPRLAPLPSCIVHKTNLPSVSFSVIAPKRNVKAALTCGMPLPAAAGTQ